MRRKKEKRVEERVDIGDINGGIFGWLVDTTNARLIDWKPTEEPPVETSYGGQRGYEGKIGNLLVKTIVRQDGNGGQIFYALQISDGQETVTITSDPKVIPGKREERGGFLGALCWHIHKGLQKQDLISSLESELGRLLFSP